MPTEFIPVAEATGLIVPLGEWVLRQACTEAVRWPKEIAIAVNLSPAQFKSRMLVPTVADALAASGLPAERLELEITELVLMEESEGAFAVLHQLRNLGIRIAMDDFGTGYSSLGYLRSFPFSTIKIDQSFIRDLPGKEDSLAIVRAVVGLSSSLGIKTIAEGVETKEQLASLTSEGCNEFQGFLFSEPRSSVELAKIINEQARRRGNLTFGRANAVGIVHACRRQHSRPVHTRRMLELPQSGRLCCAGLRARAECPSSAHAIGADDRSGSIDTQACGGGLPQ